jgi:hypothetical protein
VVGEGTAEPNTTFCVTASDSFGANSTACARLTHNSSFADVGSTVVVTYPATTARVALTLTSACPVNISRVALEVVAHTLGLPEPQASFSWLPSSSAGDSPLSVSHVWAMLSGLEPAPGGGTYLLRVSAFADDWDGLLASVLVPVRVNRVPVAAVEVVAHPNVTGALLVTGNNR